MKRTKLMIPLVLLGFTLTAAVPPGSEAPTGFDNKSNGLVDDPTHQADQAKFEEVEQIKDGLGPVYNAQSCRECHQNPTSGGPSQVTELRAGHRGPDGQFQNPAIPIARGTQTITGRSLVNDRAICPNGAFPSTEIQERVPDSETIRATRLSLNLLGDGFVEAVSDDTFTDLAREQCRKNHHRICGETIQVPVLEAPGKTAVGRFGWKDQHASLLSFASDAYLNEMGITNKLQPTEVTLLCNTVSEPNDTQEADGLEDIDHFARFIRASEAPPRDAALASTPKAQRGEQVFDKIGCNICHVTTLATAPAGTKLNAGAHTVAAALGGKTFHPYGDFLLHDVGTGDGIVMSPQEHYGRNIYVRWKNLDAQMFSGTANKLRTAPLWGVRMHPRLMHDAASLTLSDAILRHAGEARDVTHKFEKLSASDTEALLEFLKSL
ncbi:MAG TPA: di-heme oxidoredictase family protein [Terriglobia bacterium]|nr:di-heme oxidoredictase family protein [Terriglobia bacterium]